MPKPRPDYVPGGYYHFYNRGAHRVSIFREAENYVYLLRKMKTYVRELSLAPIAYCLLPNHYHFLVRQEKDQPARLLPQRIFNGYSKAYNKRYGHSGTLFEGTYKVRPVLEEAHLLHLCRYVHANPVIHGIVDHVADWPYSNYLEWVGERPGTLIDRDFVEARFHSADDYRAFVADYIATRRLPDVLDYLQEW
jgi:putative transposase